MVIIKKHKIFIITAVLIMSLIIMPVSAADEYHIDRNQEFIELIDLYDIFSDEEMIDDFDMRGFYALEDDVFIPELIEEEDVQALSISAGFADIEGVNDIILPESSIEPVGEAEVEVLAEEEVDVTLDLKSQGEEVINIQMRLRDLGYFFYKVTGYYGTATQDAVRTFQSVNGLKSDGIVGEYTKMLLFSNQAKRNKMASKEAAQYIAISRGNQAGYGQMLEWFSKVEKMYKREKVAKVTDLVTGISFYMKRTGGSNHADVEPISTSDTEKIRRIWGGWSWERRAVVVEIDGVRIAASMHGMPHAYDYISGNGMQGHVCIHFYKSRTHINNAIDVDHQSAVRKAAGR